MNPAERSTALEGLRGYAAFLVFLVHAFGLLATRVYGIDPERHAVLGDPQPMRAAVVFLFHSHYGVDLFFVLSGLLMGDLALRRWRGSRSFLWRRWLRIYPTYAVSTIALGLLAYAWLGRSPSLADALANAFLLQGFFILGFPPINPTSWSLSYEVAFYGLVPLLAALVTARPPTVRGAAPLLVLAFVLLVAVPALVPAENAIYFAYFALFVPGVALGLLDDAQRARVAARVPTLAAIVAWIAFTLAVKLSILANIPALYFLGSGIAGGLVVLKACDAKGGIARLLSSPAPRWLGRHSYSFFLVHYGVVHLWGAATARLIDPRNALPHSVVFLAGALALSLLAARLLFLATERFYFTASR
jgi:exopolysaccharide production protein ExoZ